MAEPVVDPAGNCSNSVAIVTDSGGAGNRTRVRKA